MDFSKCMIDFTACPKGIRLVDHFPELGAFDDFTSVEDENIIKIAIATADIDSPLILIKDRETMISSLFSFLDIDQHSEDGSVFYNSIVSYKHSDYMNCFARYLIMLHDIDWTQYKSTKQTHDILTTESMRPRGENEEINAFTKRKVNIQNDLKNIGNDLKKLEAKIFPDSRAAREISLNEAKKIKTYAEKYAQENTYL